MLKPPLSQLVYNALFPKPRSNDPTSFASHITRNLVPEVRVETSTFYGTLDCIEAQYPGLNYCHRPHRMRLSRFHHHRKLFRVFDELRLTEAEIASLCRWEGTKSARDRYERDEEVQVRDTTADYIRSATPPIPPSIHTHPQAIEGESLSLNANPPLETPFFNGSNSNTVEMLQDDSAVDDTSSDEDLESYGVALNQHLIQATAAREQGMDVTLDDLWEQWMKEAIERGGYTDMIDAVREGRSIDFTYRGVPQTSSIFSTSNAPTTNSATDTSAQPPANPRRRPLPLSSGDIFSTFLPLSGPEPTITSSANHGRAAR